MAAVVIESEVLFDDADNSFSFKSISSIVPLEQLPNCIYLIHDGLLLAFYWLSLPMASRHQSLIVSPQEKFFGERKKSIAHEYGD